MTTKTACATLATLLGVVAATLGLGIVPPAMAQAAPTSGAFQFSIGGTPVPNPTDLQATPVGIDTSFLLELTYRGSAPITLSTAPGTADGLPSFAVMTSPPGSLSALAVSPRPVGATPGCSGASLSTGQSCLVGLSILPLGPGPWTATVQLGLPVGNFGLTGQGDEGYFIGGSGGSEATFDTVGASQADNSQPTFVDQVNRRLNAPVVGTASTQTGNGYYQVSADGGVFSFGDAAFLGSEGGQHLNRPVVGMAAHDAIAFGSGGGIDGYWLVASDGGVFSFGNAHFYGSTGGTHLNQPIVAITATPDGGGYWLVASDGGVFSFGDAHFYGSTGGTHLNQPIVGMAAAPDGKGYWLEAADAGSFTEGSAPYIQVGFRTNADDIVGISPFGQAILPGESIQSAAAAKATRSRASWHGPGVHTRA